ncbi:PVC-type heme-binding CxxCH protein [Lewinella sp. W8]|uniref:PVC-type heme-binding CxxCH protein n=1 Tax=Lewinella sp. W8 TaxID=2528208 RepID=UPI0010684317|nr:PVC-type heme-binding CxxCH protein [Lewinella sp. W8]MTB52887.1 c-type cytochrome [Lewinella sp. W8]
MPTRILSYLLLPLLMLGCQAPEKTVDFAELPEAEKRQPSNARSSFSLHEGLGLQLFAGEPDVTNPTNIDVDERGRVWVCTAQNYRRFNHDHPEKVKGDQILILEDTDGDGQLDNRKVFYQGTDVNAALGIAKLGDKVYVAASPSVLVFTDADGDDVPEKKDTLFTGLEGVDHDHGVHAVVFGPDGKLYFNFGNEGKRLRHKDGSIARDKRGNPVEEGKTFRQGMVFRCAADGTDLEILGHNFRNNFEVAVDAYGRMWQSDNDDDGNEGTRINFVMDYGNYGFQDEITGAGWRQPRVGMHEEIPKRHWHLNDPGVVPNLLQTGSGSPTGILVYEGDQLPEIFRGQMIHCEPGHNVVRSYPVAASGAGFSASVEPLMTSQDEWFRPSDVCAAPDGSLIVADWYDAGVGGHLMADIERGRIYRLHAAGEEAYTTTPPDWDAPQQLLRALAHVNQATRYLAFQRLLEHPEGETLLREATNDAGLDDRLRARAAWCLLARKGDAQQVIKTLLASNRERLQETAIRMARQYPGPDNRNLYTVTAFASTTDAPALWREAALSLRFLKDPLANEIYVALANKYDGQDRWYLEALGIGSDLDTDQRFNAWLATEPDLESPPARRLVWRSRAAAATDLYGDYIAQNDDPAELAAFFRALHFHPGNRTSPILEQAIFTENHPRKDEVVRYALTSLSSEALRRSPRIQQRLAEVIPDVRGTDVWTMLIENAALDSEVPVLLDSALISADNNFQDKAAKIVIKVAGIDYVKNYFARADPIRQDQLIHLARHMQTGETDTWLQELRTDTNLPEGLRKRATRSLANTWNGMKNLMDEVVEGKLPEEEAVFTARLLTQCWRGDQRMRAIEWLRARSGQEAVDLDGMLAMAGDLARGKEVFAEYCAACHQVRGEGVRFGPHLDKIGDKLGREGLLNAIAYPSQGIGFGYEGFEMTMADGTKYTGYVESQTENELSLRMMGGVTRELNIRDINNKEPLAESLMTEGLHEIMKPQELADLLTYLESLTEQAQLSRK